MEEIAGVTGELAGGVPRQLRQEMMSVSREIEVAEIAEPG